MVVILHLTVGNWLPVTSNLQLDIDRVSNKHKNRSGSARSVITFLTTSDMGDGGSPNN